MKRRVIRWNVAYISLIKNYDENSWITHNAVTPIRRHGNVKRALKEGYCRPSSIQWMRTWKESNTRWGRRRGMSKASNVHRRNLKTTYHHTSQSKPAIIRKIFRHGRRVQPEGTLQRNMSQRKTETTLDILKNSARRFHLWNFENFLDVFSVKRYFLNPQSACPYRAAGYWISYHHRKAKSFCIPALPWLCNRRNMVRWMPTHSWRNPSLGHVSITMGSCKRKGKSTLYVL